MSNDPEFIIHLNAVLKHKLTAINQYFLHARMLKHMGNVALADYEYKASLEAMKQSDMLVEHILRSGGAPNLQELGKLTIGKTMPDMLRGDLTLAEAALAELETAIAFCESARDVATAALLRNIMTSQREHREFIKAQINPQERECA